MTLQWHVQGSSGHMHAETDVYMRVCVKRTWTHVGPLAIVAVVRKAGFGSTLLQHISPVRKTFFADGLKIASGCTLKQVWAQIDALAQ
jgi:hypothetical protein